MLFMPKLQQHFYISVQNVDVENSCKNKQRSENSLGSLKLR